MSLLVRNLLFTIVVPGTGAVWIPWWILTRGGVTPEPVAWPAVICIAVGVALYFTCLGFFAMVGRGTPGPWDAPRYLVAAGPYRWVRHPFYVCAALLVVTVSLVTANAIFLVAGGLVLLLLGVRTPIEERMLLHRFGDDYRKYIDHTGRFFPRLTGSR